MESRGKCVNGWGYLGDGDGEVVGMERVKEERTQGKREHRTGEFGLGDSRRDDKFGSTEQGDAVEATCIRGEKGCGEFAGNVGRCEQQWWRVAGRWVGGVGGREEL